MIPVTIILKKIDIGSSKLKLLFPVKVKLLIYVHL